MLKFLPHNRSKSWSGVQALETHNTIDPTMMSRIIGFPVSRRDFELEENTIRPLCEGVVWRRRRFRFYHESSVEHNEKTAEGLCINEIMIDSNSPAVPGPIMAADYAHLQKWEEMEASISEQLSSHLSRTARVNEEFPTAFVDVSPIHFDSSINNEEKARLIDTLEKSLAQFPLKQHLDGIGDLLEVHYSRTENIDAPCATPYLPAFPASRLLQGSSKTLAVTSGGFFLNDAEDIRDGLSAFHQPIGGLVVNKRLIAPAWMALPGIIRFTNGLTRVGLIGPEMMEIQIKGVGELGLHCGRFGEKLNGSVWRAYDQNRPKPPEGMMEIIFSGSTPIRIQKASLDTRIPNAGATVWVSGKFADSLRNGISLNQVTVNFKPLDEGTIDWVLCGGPFLVKNSAALTAEDFADRQAIGDFHPTGPAPTRYTRNISSSIGPRTAFGTLPSGGWKIVVVDGRLSGEHSLGVSLEGLAVIMRSGGCEHAINLDGGGSSILAIKGATSVDTLNESLPLGVVNIPSDHKHGYRFQSTNGKHGDEISEFVPRERILPVFLAIRQTKTGS